MGMKVHGKPGLWCVYYQCSCGVKTRYFEAVTIRKVKELITLDIRESVKYGSPLMDRRPVVQELMAVIT